MAATETAPRIRKPSESRHRNKVIATRLLPDEEVLVDRLAEREGKTIAVILRELILTRADEVLTA